MSIDTQSNSHTNFSSAQSYRFITKTPLIGRARELEILIKALRETQNSTGRCILIAGEAGIGKSRLIVELSDHAISEHFLILQGYCSEQDSSFPYAPWIDALRTFLASRNVAEANELLRQFAPELVKLLPELSLLMPSLQPSPPIDPAAEKHRLFESLTHFTTSFSATYPLLILLEDLHWSDEQSLELLHFMARRIASIPILIVGTYRSEDPSTRLAYHLSELNRTHLVEEIQLTSLDRSEVSRMVQTILQTENPVNSDWLDYLMPLTEGNPFFIEEMTKSLVQTGMQTGEWGSLQIPQSIQLAVKHRVEGLHKRTRRVLYLASVIGERFDFALLQTVSGEDEQSLLRMLKELIAAQLIIEQSADQFAFRHAITREVVYASLLLHERKAMHQTIGETLERFAKAHTEAPAAPMAYHFYQARDWQKAIEYSQQAGEKAQALYAPHEALTHFTRAIEAAQQIGTPIPLPSLRGRGQARSVLGNFDGARVDYEAIIEQARGAGDHHSEWQGLMDLGYACQPRDLERAGDYFQQALQLARTMDDAAVLGQSLDRLGNWYFFRSQPREALTLLGEALEIFQSRGDRRGTAETLQLMGMASYGIGDVIQGVAYYEQAIPLLRIVDDRQGLVRALEFLTLRARLDTEVLGQVIFSQLASYSEQAFEIAHSFDWREGEGEALSRTAISWIRVGEYTRGLELLQRAQRLGEEIEHRHLLTSVNLLFGELYLGLLALDQARYHLELAFTLAKEVGALQLFKSLLPLLVSLYIQQRDLPEAQAVLAVLPHTENVDEINKSGINDRLCWSAQAELEIASKHPEHALEIVDLLISSAQNIVEFGPQAIPWLSQLKAEALIDLGHQDDAINELIGAQATARARGELPLLWRLHADLGKVYRASGRRQNADQEFFSARHIIQNLVNHVPEGALREDFLHQALATIPAEHVPTQRQAEKKEFGGLTAREREIALLIAHGKSNREIADELVISEKTAERHVANIMAKLGFNARTQIAAWVVTKRLDK